MQQFNIEYKNEIERYKQDTEENRNKELLRYEEMEDDIKTIRSEKLQLSEEVSYKEDKIKNLMQANLQL